MAYCVFGIEDTENLITECFACECCGWLMEFAGFCFAERFDFYGSVGEDGEAKYFISDLAGEFGEVVGLGLDHDCYLV